MVWRKNVLLCPTILVYLLTGMYVTILVLNVNIIRHHFCAMFTKRVGYSITFCLSFALKKKQWPENVLFISRTTRPSVCLCERSKIFMYFPCWFHYEQLSCFIKRTFLHQYFAIIETQYMYYNHHVANLIPRPETSIQRYEA